MSDIFKYVDKNNSTAELITDKIQIKQCHIKDDFLKIPKFEKGGICNGTIFQNFSQIDEIVKDIQEKKDNAMVMEFTKRIGELLKKNGVVPKVKQFGCDFYGENSFQSKSSVIIDELDFSEHDKVFEDKIAKLENIINHKLGGWDKHGITYREILDMKAENQELKQRIAELESKETDTNNDWGEPYTEPNIEWYDNRHQSDCIEINRLNTTIDVLIHKVEYLRQFAGLE